MTRETRKREDFTVAYDEREDLLHIVDKRHDLRYAVSLAVILQKFLEVDLEGRVPKY